MPDNLVPTVNTPLTPASFARAVLKVRPDFSKEAVGILWAHFGVETGAGPSCWNFNVGNVKYTRGCGYDYVALVHNKEADAAGHFYETAKSSPASWFRAYPNFEVGMRAFVDSKTTGQWKSTLPFIEAGDPEGYAAELKRHGYYTAPLKLYQDGMRAWFNRWMKLGAWEEVIEPAPDTEPVLVPSVPPRTERDFDVVYAMPEPLEPPDDVA